MADTAFGIQELNLIGASGTPTIESPNNLNLTAVNVAISTDASVGGTLTAHQIDGNITGAGATFTDGINLKYASVSGAASTVTYVVKVATKSANHRWRHQGSSSGYTINGIESPLLTLKPGVDYVFDQSDSSNATHPIRFYYDAKKSAPYSTHLAKTFNFDITNNGSGAYTFTAASDRSGGVSGDDPTVTIWVGDTIRIKNNAASAHPLNVNRSNTTGTSARVDTPAATNQGTYSGGIVSWTPNTPGTYFYNCQNHGFMAGLIKVLNPPGVAYCSGSSNTIQNVIKAGSAGAATTISILGDTPTVVHYQCLAHGYMGHALVSNTSGTTGNPDLTVAGIVTAKNFVPTVGQLSNRNLVINGAFNVAQRGTSDTTSGQGFTTVDRWSIVWNGMEEVISRYQETLTSADAGPWEKGFRNAWKVQNGNQTGGADANGYINSYTAIEAQDIASSGWDYTDPNSKITLSFWVKSSVAQTFYGYLKTEDGTDQAYSFSYTPLAANVWTKVTKTIPGSPNITINNDNGMGLAIYLPTFLGTDRTATGNVMNTWAAYSSSSRTPNSNTGWLTTNDSTWHLTGIQLEVGEVATPFEHRSYSDELARCQRYFYMHASGAEAQQNNRAPIVTGSMYSTTSFYGVIDLPVRMRTTPSLYKVVGTDYFRVYANSGADTCNDLAHQNSTPTTYAINVYDGLSRTLNAGAWAETDNSAARVGFSAEL